MSLKNSKFSFDKFTYFIIQYRVVVITLTLISLFVFAYFLKDIGVEGSYRIWFKKDSEIIQHYDTFMNNFGSDSRAVIAFEKDNLFDKETLQDIRDITDALSSSQYIVSSTSITNFPAIIVEGENGDEIVVRSYFEYLDDLTQDEIDSVKETILKDNFITGRILSKDAKATIISARLSQEGAIEGGEVYRIISDNVAAILAPYEAKGYKFYVTGDPIVQNQFVVIATNDGIIFTTIAILSVLLLLFFMFRTYLGTLIPMFIVIFTFILVISLQTILGYKLNSFTANLPIFILAIGIVHAVHFYWIWAIGLKKGMDTNQAIAYSMNKNFNAIALTSLTTAIGFASLGISDVVPIRTLGIASATSAVIAFTGTIVFMPAVLSYFTSVTNVREPKTLINPLGYADFISRNDKKIVLISLGLAIFFSIGFYNVKINNNAIEYFQESHIVRQSIEFIKNNITGPMGYEIVVDSGSENGIKEPEFLANVDKFSKEFNAQFEDVLGVSSLADTIKEFNRLMHNQDDAFNIIPQTKDEIGQYLLLYNLSLPAGVELNDRVDITNQFLRISCNTNSVSSTQDIMMIDWANEWWAKTKYKAFVTGQVAMFAKMQMSIVDTLVYSLLTAVILISVVMFFIFRDIKLLGYFLIPNLFPLLAALGAMGWLNINLDMGVAISAAIILGIAVDDTIHFFNKYLSHRANGYNIHDSIEYVMQYTGGAIILTTVVLSLSFFMLLFSSFNPNVFFAVTTITALIVALIANLLLLPALFSIRNKKLFS